MEFPKQERELSEAGKLEWEIKDIEERHAREKDAQRGLNEWDKEEQLGEDHLTGLKNRKFFEKELGKALRAIRAGVEEHHRAIDEQSKSVAVMFLDLDNFKNVNNFHSHKKGDEVLQRVAKILRSSVRDTDGDVVARFGGDEFYILFPQIKKEDVEVVGNKILANLKNDQELIPFKIGASIGISTSSMASDAEGLVHLADLAAKFSKESGKNRVSVYSPAI